MPVSWQSLFLDALLGLDAAESPHGLYGIRFAHAAAPVRLPTLAQVLLSPERTNFIGKLGLTECWSDAKRDKLSFFIDPSSRVEMHVLDNASTKVRHFGSSYRLDTHYRKPTATPAWNLEKLLPKLAASPRSLRQPFTLSRCLLLVAHAPSVKALHAMLGRALEEGLLRRYALTLDRREWEDSYGRAFHSGLYLWTAEPPGDAGSS